MEYPVEFTHCKSVVGDETVLPVKADGAGGGVGANSGQRAVDARQLELRLPPSCSRHLIEIRDRKFRNTVSGSLNPTVSTDKDLKLLPNTRFFKLT
ncbi:hypothetical protein HZH68_008404 [Vespula germanica]|uniref:Uncharacterized protein n=1 Tax=Vespula germanica TaxID=30212 RepID=A0A834N868_VESGE|nr:hypothetical protein HZH68_008404 [Vespula germanica]